MKKNVWHLRRCQSRRPCVTCPLTGTGAQDAGGMSHAAEKPRLRRLTYRVRLTCESRAKTQQRQGFCPPCSSHEGYSFQPTRLQKNVLLSLILPWKRRASSRLINSSSWRPVSPPRTRVRDVARQCVGFPSRLASLPNLPLLTGTVEPPARIRYPGIDHL